MVRRSVALAYGVVVYVIFLAVLAATVLLLVNGPLVRGIDEGASSDAWTAAAIDAGLLGLFALQHTVMARPGFKRWSTRVVPESIERSTFVLAASSVLALLLWLWQPLPATVWSVDEAVLRALLYVLYGVGWFVVVAGTFLIDHFDLFGLKQVVARARGRRYERPGFRQPLAYRLVRHPIMVGFLIAFWAAPDMTAGRLLFAGLGTGYILVGVRFEEHDLRAAFGQRYVDYTAEVPRFVPRLSLRLQREPEERYG
jgi:protein-S-isoprenylcysteine O-methyltransferase Ste14